MITAFILWGYVLAADGTLSEKNLGHYPTYQACEDAANELSGDPPTNPTYRGIRCAKDTGSSS